MFISHRGNLIGRNPALENSPAYIDQAIKSGFHVEIDVWATDDSSVWLGHDKAEHHMFPEFLTSRREVLICHAKTVESLYVLKDLGMHCFYHEDPSPVTMTSWGSVWCAPSTITSSYSVVCVNDPYTYNYDLIVAGIYSDYIKIIKKNFEDNKI